MTKIAIVIIIILIILITYHSYIYMSLINGNWITTEEFEEKSGGQIYLNIAGYARKNCRFLFVQNDAVVEDCDISFIPYPHNFLFMRCISGWAMCKSEVFPKKMYFYYDPFNCYLKLYSDILHGEFIKVPT